MINETVKKYLIQVLAALAIAAATFCVTQGVNNKIYRGGFTQFRTPVSTETVVDGDA